MHHFCVAPKTNSFDYLSHYFNYLFNEVSNIFIFPKILYEVHLSFL